ncbi:MAG TPA: CRTAC1 family protein, partial [Armatimonadota bacterium]|nr:CRTAC1 family protein [Armatimonadota bacterium]
GSRPVKGPIMQNPRARIIVTVLFVALIAAPMVWSRLAAREGAAAAGDGAAALSQFGFRLEEVSRSSGIEFVHEAPKLDPALGHILPQVASMGAAVSVVDFDRDGWNDMYVTNSGEGTQNRLYRNLGNGKFQDVAAAAGVADVNQVETGVSTGAIWGDYDNDGYEDLFLNKWGRPELFHNDGGKKFTRVTETAGLPKWVNANSAVWFDYDRDGRLDLFIGGYYREDINLWRLASTRIMPDSFSFATNGGRKFLFHNRGDGTFEDVTAQMGLESRRWSLAAGAADLRGTGYPDLMIANDYGYSECWANEGGKRFREIGKQVGVGERSRSGMNVSFGDVFNRGQLAVYVTNISEESALMQLNDLWVPREGASGENLRYDNMASDMGVDKGGWSFGTQFGDLNNDGWSDLFLTNGYISAGEKSYWYSYSEITGASGGIISDAKNWPAIEDMSLSGHQKKHVWLNDRGKRFVDVAQMVGVTETKDGRSVAMADFGNRGALDVVVAHQKGPLLFYRNTVAPENAWIDFELEGVRSNRSAIGAQVRVFWNGQQQLQQVSGASGFCAQSQRRLHFGLGKGAQVEKVVIRWPSGKEQTLAAPAVGKVHAIKEAV